MYQRSIIFCLCTLLPCCAFFLDASAFLIKHGTNINFSMHGNGWWYG